jgi:hypothetical protein
LISALGWKEMMIGGADGIRTHDLLDAIEARSQLRHGPTAQELWFFYNTRHLHGQTNGNAR